MNVRTIRVTIAAAAMVVGVLPMSAAASEGAEEPAYAAASTIPGLYAVSELVSSLSGPTGAAIDPLTGEIWIADFGLSQVNKYDHSGQLLESIDSVGNGTGQVASPGDVAIANSEIFVADTGNDRIQVFDPDGTYLRMWGTTGVGAGQFSEPCAIETIGNRVFVAEGGNDRIQVFNKDNGAFVNQFGSPGAGDGQLNITCFAGGISHHNGELFVVDAGNDRIAVFDLDGNWQRNFGSATFSQPAGVDATSDGTIWATDCTTHEVTLWSPTGTLLDSFGSQGSALGALNCPAGIVVDPTGDTVWVGEAINNRLQVFTTRLCRGMTLTHIGTSYDDTFTTGAGDDVVRLGLGDDELNTGAGNDTVCAGGGNDIVRGGAGVDFLVGEHDNDKLFGGPGADTLRGADGRDVMWGGPGPDLIEGGAGRDIGRGQDGGDILKGGGGNDTLKGEKGVDTISGDVGSDTLNGGSHNDVLFGRAGNDTLLGAAGNDTLNGNPGNDTLRGNAGDDALNGGPGTDECFGNTGIDIAAACETVVGVP